MKQIISPLLQIGICAAGYLYATSNVTLAIDIDTVFIEECQLDKNINF